MLTKAFALDVKEIGDAGTFAGYASVYNVTDSYGDIVVPGAFTRTMQEKNGEVVILNQHDTREPIGLGKLEDSAEGLKIFGELNLDVRVAQEAYSNLRKGILKGLSIGYMVRADEYDRQAQIRKLTDIDLMEVSLVTFQACPGALVTAVKADGIHTIRDFEGFLRDAGFSQREAKAIASHGFKALQRDADEPVEPLPSSDTPDPDEAAAAAAAADALAEQAAAAEAKTADELREIAALFSQFNNEIKGALQTWKA